MAYTKFENILFIKEAKKFGIYLTRFMGMIYVLREIYGDFLSQFFFTILHYRCIELSGGFIRNSEFLRSEYIHIREIGREYFFIRALFNYIII